MPNISNYSIHHANNFYSKFKDNYSTIFSQYMRIINEYLKHCEENIFIQNPVYKTYIIKNGLLSLTHIFNFLLIYTKNLDLIYYNCQKSYVYYIEFISQIGDDNHTFLQLNSKDAALFIYKKTIFDIDNDIRKDYITDNISTQITNTIDILINIYTTLLFQLINNEKLIKIIEISNTDLPKIMSKIIKLYIDSDEQFLHAIRIFVTLFKNDNIIEYLDTFIKKIKKSKTLNLNKLELELISSPTFTDLDTHKYISNLVSYI